MTRQPSFSAPSGGGLPTATFPGTDLVTSAVGFGCAGLYTEPSAAQRRRLLDAALDAGVAHFDVAPMYGLGIAERELGRFASGRRGDVVIATKFGIAPGAAAWPLARVQGPVRRLLRASPALRRQARASAAGPSTGRAGALLYRATGFDAAAARASLEHSLRELNSDYVDLLLLHDPQPGHITDDDVCAYLEEERRSGRIRAWGVAGDPEPALQVARALKVPPPVLQVRDDILSRAGHSPNARVCGPRITFGILGGAVGQIISYVDTDVDRHRRWSDAVGGDCRDPEFVATLLLRLAVRRNPHGVVLFSTTRTAHVRSSVKAFDPLTRTSAPDLDAFVRLVAAELGGSWPSESLRAGDDDSG